MANKFEISVSADASRMKDLKRQVEQAKTLSQGQVSTTGGTAGTHQDRVRVQLEKDMVRELRELTRAMREKRGGPSGGGASGGSSQTLGGVGAAIPFLGAALGVAAFVTHQILNMGRAYINTAAQQIGTAGVGGFRGGTSSTYFSVAQTAEFSKARRMASGSYSAGGPGGTQGWEMAESYAKRFGLDASGVGHTVGLMEALNPRGGARQFGQILNTASRGGIQTELPLLMQGISTSLEDAVTRGVNASDLATEIATEVSLATRLAPNGSIRAGIALSQQQMGLQNQVANGQYSGVSQWRMFEAGRGIVESAVSGRGHSDVRNSLMQAGVLTGDMLNRTLAPEETEYLTRYYMAQNPAAARNAYGEDLYRTLGNQGLSTFSRQLSVMGIESDPIKQQMMFNRARASVEGYTPSLTAPGGDFQAPGNSAAFRARGLENRHTSMLLRSGGPAEKAAGMVERFELSLMRIADSASGPVARGLDGLNTVFTSMANGVDNLTQKLQRLQTMDTSNMGALDIIRFLTGQTGGNP
jgi:hypothetical protein